MERIVLNVEKLHVKFATDAGTVTAVSDLSFKLYEKETLCLVGESGSGKSVTALAMMGLLPKPAGIIGGGKIELFGKDLIRFSEKEMQNIRGNSISMIFQEPMTTLNPVYTVGYQIGEVLRKHKNMNKKAAFDYSRELLEKVGVPDPSRRVKQYPHELSGGLRQRVMISMALACNPAILIADEPTTALDVTVQAQVLELINSLKKEFNMSVIFISHDLGVVSQIADRIIVMYGGMKMEEAPAKAFFANSVHPYTIGLLNCLPHLAKEQDKLTTIPGIVPSLSHMPGGCRFSTRCGLAFERCFARVPDAVEIEKEHYVSCFRYGKEKKDAV